MGGGGVLGGFFESVAHGVIRDCFAMCVFLYSYGGFGGPGLVYYLVFASVYGACIGRLCIAACTRCWRRAPVVLAVFSVTLLIVIY